MKSLLTSNEHISAGTLVLERWRVSVNGQVLVGVNGAALIDGLTDHVDDSAQSFGADGHLDGSTSVDHSLSSDQTLSGVESDGPHVVSSKMLGDLENESVASALDLKRIENGRKLAGELHVHDGTNDLGNFSVGRGEGPFTDNVRCDSWQRSAGTYFWKQAWQTSVTRSYEIIIIK